MIESFHEFDVPVPGAAIHGSRGGDGPPLLLLHGFPESHVMWHRIAPVLAREFSVVATDLNGFGDSTSSGNQSMRELARLQVEAMKQLRCPTLVLWEQDGSVGRWYGDPIDIWRNWADDVTGGPVASGHFLPEEAPEETLAWLLPFLHGS
ncbi:alpha/beta fold hydrolase [Kribbella soli]|uniref:Alpha/beta fold hydrolase n=1 Tax=Kribbella soli TaxID=1124743 RepID=A0A4R0HIX1_9ACTN|nr:alpha/beta fold hydrolase [Kribbella soli]TCC11317.1 alpha/beta fold hydrolase [Kribbella soli]